MKKLVNAMARKYMYLLLKTTSEGDGNKAYIIMNLWITKLKIARNIPSHITHCITGFARTFCRQLLYCNQYYVHVIWNSHQDCAWVILMDFCYCCCCCFWVIFMVKLLICKKFTDIKTCLMQKVTLFWKIKKKSTDYWKINYYRYCK